MFFHLPQDPSCKSANFKISLRRSFLIIRVFVFLLLYSNFGPRGVIKKLKILKVWSYSPIGWKHWIVWGEDKECVCVKKRARLVVWMSLPRSAIGTFQDLMEMTWCFSLKKTSDWFFGGDKEAEMLISLPTLRIFLLYILVLNNDLNIFESYTIGNFLWYATVFSNVSLNYEFHSSCTISCQD